MKIESKVFHRKDAKHAEMIHLFSLSRMFFGTKKNGHALPSGLEGGQGLKSSKNLREALGLSLFCPLSRKGNKVIASAAKQSLTP
jgi:hypothetical protein